MRESMTNYGDYLCKGLISKEQFCEPALLFYQQQNAWQSLNTQAIQASLQISKLESESITKGIEHDNQISQYQAQRSDASARRRRCQRHTVDPRPSEGKIENMSVTEGQMVGAGDRLTN